MDKAILFAALVIFPFGQILKFGIVNLFDAVVCLLAVYTLFKQPKFPSWYKYLFSFILFGLFSWVVNLFLVKDELVFKGLLYLFRLFFYSLVGVYIYNFFKSKKEKDLILNALLSVSVFSAIFGWFQYLIYSDTRALIAWGWDDHLYRMIGSFIDPTFLGILLVLGIIIAIYKSKNIITLFLMFSLAFTYSRAAFAVLALVLLLKKKFLFVAVFLLMLLLTPKTVGEGTNLARSSSGYAKLQNYSDSLKIIEKSPLIGVGFNNVCSAKIKYLNIVDTDSHACFGLDSSLLFILATTGIVGLFLFLTFILKVSGNSVLKYSFLAVFVHALFSNSLFYPHVMFWLFSLLGLQRETQSET